MEALTRITLDLLRPSYETVYAAPLDCDSRGVIITLVAGSQAWTPPAGTSAAIEVKKPDGSFCVYDTLEDGETTAYTISGNTITILWAQQALTAAGQALAAVRFYNASGKKLSTFTFRLVVPAGAVPGADIESTDYFSPGGGDSAGGGGTVTIDSALSANSTNPVQNRVIKAALDAKGTYSKPSGGIPETDLSAEVRDKLNGINQGGNATGSGGSALDSATLDQLVLGGGGNGGSITVTIDSALSANSTNPVQNRVIKAALDAKGTYSKPSGGIPASDLAAAVQTSLGKADSALQSVPNTYRTAAAQNNIDAGKQTKITATGILKGDGAGGVTAATAGTDYGTYSKPSGGIPETDLADAVRTKLSALAFTALSVSVPAISAGGTVTVQNITGVTSNSTLLVQPAPADFLLWRNCGVRCTAQGSGTLTFAAESATGQALTANILILGG